MTQVPSIVLSVTDKYGGHSRIERVGGLKEYSIGRGYEADDPNPATILIPDAMVSPRHCSIEWDEVDSWILRDVGSVNGTVVAGEVLKDSHRLGRGSEFKIGGSVLRLEYALDNFDDAAAVTDQENTDADGDLTLVVPADDDQTVVDLNRWHGGEDLVRAGEPSGLPQQGLEDSAGGTMPKDTALTNGSGQDETSEQGQITLAREALRSVPRPKLRGEIAALVEAGLLGEAAALDYMERAQENGETFFARLVRDHRVGNINKIFDWVSRYLNCDNYTDIEQLMEVAREEPWLPASVAERRGVILLEPGQDGVARYATIFPFDIVLHDWVEQCTGGRAKTSSLRRKLREPAMKRALLTCGRRSNRPSAT